MAKNESRPKSGFDAPVYGTVEKIPVGCVAKMDKNGVVRYVPKEKKSKKK